MWYTGGYAQDVWRLRSNVTLTAGLRLDVPIFDDTGYTNPNVDVLTFRDETGAAVQYQSGKLPDPKVLWSPRFGFNWDVASNQNTQVRGGTGVFTGKPAYVWISNQIGNTGMLTGFIEDNFVTNRPFNPNPDFYKPATVTGAPAASVDLAVTDPDFKFPQTWRSNVGVDQKFGWGLIGTAEFIYNKDVNGVYYINANLPEPQASFVGADNRPRWTGAACGSPTVGPCATRLNNAAGNQITNAIVLKNQDVGRSWNFAASLMKTLEAGVDVQERLQLRRIAEHGRPGLDRGGLVHRQCHQRQSEQPGAGVLEQFAGPSLLRCRLVQQAVLRLWRDDCLGVLGSANRFGNASYVFAGDMNGDTASGNDLIYIPRDVSEMNFSPFTAGTRTFTAAEQAAAWEAYIAQDTYLSKHRGQYAERGGRVPPARQAHGPERQPGHLRHARRPAALRADPAGHRQLRQPAELELGRQPTAGAEPDSDERQRRRGDRPRDLPDGGRQRRAADDVLPVDVRHRGCLHADAQLQVQLQLDPCSAEC